jgi:hypothetical protein
MTVIEEIAEECECSQEQLVELRRGLAVARSMGIVDVPDDKPYRAAIRGLAVMVLGDAVVRFGLHGERGTACIEAVQAALSDPSWYVRLHAANSLFGMRTMLAEEKLIELAPTILSILQEPEVLQACRAKGRMPEAVTEHWREMHLRGLRAK